MFKTSTIIAGAISLFAAPASAAYVFTTAVGVILPGETLFSDFDGTSRAPTGSGFDVFSGDVPGRATSVDGSRYLAVFAGGIATYEFAGVTSLSFDAGTVDPFNFMQVGFRDGTALKLGDGGSEILPGGPPRFNIATDPGQYITSVSFGSTRNSFEIDNIATGSVPEPTSWALMLLGFGVLGSRLRLGAKRRVVASDA